MPFGGLCALTSGVAPSRGRATARGGAFEGSWNQCSGWQLPPVSNPWTLFFGSMMGAMHDGSEIFKGSVEQS